MTENKSQGEEVAKKMEELALQIAEAAMKRGVTLSDKIEAFKVLTPYHIGTSRVVKKTSTQQEEVTTFGHLREKMRNAD